MAHVEAVEKEWVSLRGSRPTLPPRPTGFSRQPLGGCSPRLCRLGLSVLGRVGYDGKPRGPRILWLIGFHRRIDDCGTGKLTLNVALSDALLDLLKDVGDVEGRMVRRCRHHRDLCPALRELSLEDGQRQLRSDFGLPGEDRDHPRFKASFGLPPEALKSLVRFAP